MAAAAMPTDGDADTLPLKRADLPTLEEIATAFPDLEILGLIGHGNIDDAITGLDRDGANIFGLKHAKAAALNHGGAPHCFQAGRRQDHPGN